MRNFMKSAALAIIVFATGCGEIGGDKKLEPCPQGTVRDPAASENVCRPVDGGVPEDELCPDRDRDGFVDANALECDFIGDDCDDRDNSINTGADPILNPDVCVKDAHRGADVDCDGIGDCLDECYRGVECRDGNPATEDTCVEGLCRNERITPDLDCDDLIFCTVDRAEDGMCRHDPDNGRCEMGTVCSPALGRCVPTGCVSDEECDDGDPCNGAEECNFVTGACVAGSPPSCNDGVDCTVDSCMDGDCVHTAAHDRCSFFQLCDRRDGCVSAGECERDEQCGDGLRCNGVEQCTFGFCESGSPRCNDGDPRTVDGCSEVTGECVYTRRGTCLVDEECDDDNWCTGTEACNHLGECVQVTPAPICDDGNPDTIDACNSRAHGCDHTRGAADECVPGITGSCVTPCGTAGSRTCSADARWGSCQHLGDQCNGADDDCDGLIDEGGACGCVPRMEVCNTLDDDCDSFVDEGNQTCGVGACQRTTSICASCNPGTPSSEACNSVDDDCDGSVDEGCVGMVANTSANQMRARTLGSFFNGLCGVGYVTRAYGPGGTQHDSPAGGELAVTVSSWPRNGVVWFSVLCGGSYTSFEGRVGQSCASIGFEVRLDGADQSFSNCVVASDRDPVTGVDRGAKPRIILP